MTLRSLPVPLKWLCVIIGTVIVGAAYSAVFFAGYLRDCFEGIKEYLVDRLGGVRR